MMEVPDLSKHEELMDFQKFAQSVKGLIYSEEKVWIVAKFKEKGNEKIHSGDNFLANKVHTSGKQTTAEEIYKTYLEWFNRTLRYGEDKRIFVSAKFGEKPKTEVEE